MTCAGLGDATMADGLEGVSVARIGFLNVRGDDEKLRKSLPLYERAFDAVILNDGPMDWLNGLLGVTPQP